MYYKGVGTLLLLVLGYMCVVLMRKVVSFNVEVMPCVILMRKVVSFNVKVIPCVVLMRKVVSFNVEVMPCYLFCYTSIFFQMCTLFLS